MMHKNVVWLIKGRKQTLSLAESLKTLIGVQRLAVFRSWQEALAQSAKHSHPRLVIIEGIPQAGELTTIRSRLPGVRVFGVAAYHDDRAMKSRASCTFLRRLPERAHVQTCEYHLTRREREILLLMARGLATKEIAEILSLSFHTVNNHERRIYKKMNVHNKAAAVAKALTVGSLSG